MKKYVLTASLWMVLVSIKLLAQAPQYCASKGTLPWEQWIERVSMSSGNFSNPSGKEGYGNFTNLTGASLKRSVGNLITISPKSSWNGDPRNANMFWRVWVDLNADGDFTDAGEMVISRQVIFNSGVFLDNEAAFTPPSTAKLGKTRLRIAMKVGSYPEPCETFERGEVEDYTVDIMDGTINNSCRFQDSLQLVSLYNASNGNIWLNKWSLNTPINTWYGVSLNANGCVVGINLENNNMMGTLPNLNLPNLELLAMRNNRFSGTIPNLNCPNLRYLYLAANQFSGTIPVFNCPNLSILMLYKNLLTGTIPNFNYPQLTALHLDENLLTGILPNFSYPNLTSLHLNNNLLTGSIPNFNCPNLVELFLSDNQLSGAIPNFNYPNMEKIYLMNNKLTGSIPNFNFPKIIQILMYNNQLSGCIPLSLKAFCGKQVEFQGNPNLLTQDFNAFCNTNAGACSPSLQPDLTMENLNIPTPSVFQGNILSYFFDLKNIGTGNATGTFNVKAYISKDNILSADDIQEGVVPTGNFNAGFSVLQVPGTSTIPSNLALGSYYLILKADADNQITESNENNNVISKPFEVVPVSGTYCFSKGNQPWEQWIEGFSIAPANFRNASGKEGYGNFTSLTGATLKRNAGNFITISPNASWGGNPLNTNMYWRVWVDLNGDKDFEDAGEMLINRKVTISNGVFLDNESSFFIPLSAKLGSTRLRVSMKVGGEPTPCEVFERGEVEDYTVDIIGEPIVNRDTLRLVDVTGASSVRQGGQITLNVTIKNTGTAPSNPNTPLSIYQNQQPFIFKGPPPTYLTIVSDRRTIGRVIQPNETVTVPISFTVFSNFSHITRPDYTGVEYKGTYVVIGNRSNDILFYPYFYPVLDTLTSPYNITALLDNTDLKIDITATDTTYKRDGKHGFVVKVTNNGTVAAKDVLANLGTVSGSFSSSVFTAPTVTPQRGTITYTTRFGSGTYIIWNINNLAPNESLTASVEYSGFAVPYTLPDYTHEVKVASNQIIDNVASNNVATKRFVLDTTAVVNTQYCAAKGTAPWEQWISQVIVFTNVVVTPFSPTAKEGYGDFSNGTAAIAQRGSGGLITIFPQSSWPGDPRNKNMFWRVWMDFNHDNDFDDAGEMVASRIVGITSSNIFFDNDNGFSVPTTALLGRTRMRVAMKVGGYPLPCETFERGEVEDYAINIIENNAIQPLIVQGDLRVVPLEGSMRMDWVRKSNIITDFEIEKSTDGENFERIATIPATQDKYHVAFDNAPNEGDNFYRLKMNLNNGEAVYSSIQKAKYEKLLDFTIFPNPSSDEVYIDLKKYEGKAVDIFMADINGKIVFNKVIENVSSAPLRLDLNAVENGFYGVVIKSKGKRDVLRLVQVLR
jgi:hypothetical protein